MRALNKKMILSSVFFLFVNSYAHAEEVQATENVDLAQGIFDCEKSLIDTYDERLPYDSNSCSTYISQLDVTLHEYALAVHADVDIGHSPYDLTVERQNERTALCMSAIHNSAAIFDNMDQSGCDQAVTTNSSWGVSGPRIPTGSSSNTGGLYRSGVTYTTVGNQISGSDGSHFVRTGNMISGNNGDHYNTRSGTTFDSRGNVYIHSGSHTFGPNGVQCVTTGIYTHCR